MQLNKMYIEREAFQSKKESVAQAHHLSSHAAASDLGLAALAAFLPFVQHWCLLRATSILRLSQRFQTKQYGGLARSSHPEQHNGSGE